MKSFLIIESGEIKKKNFIIDFSETELESLTEKEFFDKLIDELKENFGNEKFLIENVINLTKLIR